MSLNIALSSYTGYGAWFILRLLKEGHKVDYYLSDPFYQNILKGIVPAPKLVSGRNYPNYGKYDLSIFDLTGKERQAEYSSSLCPTIGDGAFNNAMENDRRFGIEAMELAGIKVPPYESFIDVGAAKAFIKKTGKRYVYKPDGIQDDKGTTYVAKDSNDMLKYLEKVNKMSKGQSFILQEFISGTEISVEGWFDGDEFHLINFTLEEKKFMNDNKGPNTGCSGNLVSILAGEPKIYKHGLYKMKQLLSESGFTGMIDLNCIVTNQEIYGLEWTPRFGYHASPTLFNMYAGNLGEMLQRITIGERPEQSWKAEFGVGITLSIPPYPSEIKGKHPSGIEITGIEEKDYDRTFMYDVELQKDTLVTAGASGFIAVPIGIGSTIGEAFYACQKRVDKINIPNIQYRTDIEKAVLKRYNQLNVDGWLV
jgi:phosphoribosylamine--glycine ligase